MSDIEDQRTFRTVDGRREKEEKNGEKYGKKCGRVTAKKKRKISI